MNFLYQISLRARIYATTGFAALLLCFIAGWSYHSFHQTTGELHSTYRYRIAPIQQLTSLIVELKKPPVHSASATGSHPRTRRLGQIGRQDWALFTAKAAHLSKSSAEKTLIAQIGQTLQQIEALPAVYLQPSQLPLFDKTVARRNQLSQQAVTAIVQLVAIQGAAAHAQYLHMESRQAHAVVVLGSIAALGLVLLISISLYLGYGINRDVGAVRTALAQVATGDLTVRVTQHGSAEFKQMGDSLNEALEQVGQAVAETLRAAKRTTTEAAALQDLADGTGHDMAAQAEQIMMINVAMEEMASTVANVARNAQTAADSAELSQTAASNGEKIGNRTTQSLATIREAAQTSTQATERLSAATVEIGKVAGQIADIAEQTNLLALNAAIEAARAGERGKGFAVVADEVRQLSQRTAESTKDIGNAVQRVVAEGERVSAALRQVVAEVEQGVEKGSESLAALHQIRNAAETVRDLVVQIATAAEEQAATTDEIVRNVTAVHTLADKTTGRIADTSQEISALLSTADSLEAAVATFKA